MFAGPQCSSNVFACIESYALFLFVLLACMHMRLPELLVRDEGSKPPKTKATPGMSPFCLPSFPFFLLPVFFQHLIVIVSVPISFQLLQVSSCFVFLPTHVLPGACVTSCKWSALLNTLMCWMSAIGSVRSTRVKALKVRVQVDVSVVSACLPDQTAIPRRMACQSDIKDSEVFSFLFSRSSSLKFNF